MPDYPVSRFAYLRAVSDVTAPDPFVALSYNFLLERTPKAKPTHRTWRKDEYRE